MATLGLKEMGKFLWEGREKSLPSWLSQFSFDKLRQTSGQTFFPTFPKEFFHFFKPKVAIIAELFWKMQIKTWYSILRVDTMPLSLKNLLLKRIFRLTKTICISIFCPIPVSSVITPPSTFSH